MIKSFNLLIVKGLALALALSVSAAGFLYLDNQAKAASVATLTTERDTAVGQLAQARDDLAANRELIRDQRNSDRRTIAQANRVLEEINDAAPEADGPVAPVLADALVAINGMWDAAGYQRPDGDAPDRTARPLPKPAAAIADFRKPAGSCRRSDAEHADGDIVLYGDDTLRR